MSVRVVRTRSNEDVICDLYEVTTKEEPEKAIAFQLTNPYTVWIGLGEPEIEVTNDSGDIINKTSSPELHFEPWIPLAKDKHILLKLDEVITAYETHPEVVEKYTKLVEAANGRADGQTGTPEGEG